MLRQKDSLLCSTRHIRADSSPLCRYAGCTSFGLPIRVALGKTSTNCGTHARKAYFTPSTYSDSEQGDGLKDCLPQNF